jgi:hypothetical protein
MGSSNKKRDSLFLSMKLHIGYVRSIEDSPRVRAASVQYLQNWLLEFYPERPDIVAEARGLAAELGGHLSDPKLPPQYHWLRGVLGWPAAKKLSRKVPQWRLAAAHLWDQVLP